MHSNICLLLHPCCYGSRCCILTFVSLWELMRCVRHCTVACGVVGLLFVVLLWSFISYLHNCQTTKSDYCLRPLMANWLIVWIYISRFIGHLLLFCCLVEVENGAAVGSGKDVGGFNFREPFRRRIFSLKKDHSFLWQLFGHKRNVVIVNLIDYMMPCYNSLYLTSKVVGKPLSLRKLVIIKYINKKNDHKNISRYTISGSWWNRHNAREPMETIWPPISEMVKFSGTFARWGPFYPRVIDAFVVPVSMDSMESVRFEHSICTLCTLHYLQDGYFDYSQMVHYLSQIGGYQTVINCSPVLIQI